MTKFVRDIQNRNISYTQANVQAEVFLKALEGVVEAPGDWHTGLNMLTLIYNLYYHGFLEQFQCLQVLYHDNPFFVPQELRMNRVVRRYHSDIGKRCVPQDEFLENGNRFFSTFPMPKTLTSFAFQSQYVGLGLMSKRFTNLWYTTSRSGDAPRDYTKHVPSMMTPKRRLLFQVFCLLKTHIVDPTRDTGD